ncbi:hypothetical protein Tco_0957497 [Tanacetum coccineum]
MFDTLLTAKLYLDRVKSDDLNITLEEYIRLEEEKAQRHGRMFNWQTATFGKVKYYEDEDDCFTDVEIEFPAIVFDNTLTSDTTLSCEPTVSPPNENKIDFRISLDESDDEDYTIIFDENSFSYKIIFVNDLKTNSENDNGKNNMPSSPKPTIDYLDDLDCFNDFENEFPTIVYNNGLTSKSELLIEPPEYYGGQDMAPLPPTYQRHLWLRYQVEGYDEGIDLAVRMSDTEMGLDVTDTLCFQLGGVRKRMTWRYPYVLFNISYTLHLHKTLIRHMAPLPYHNLRHPWLRYQVDGYDKGIVHSYEQRLETIWGRPVNRVHDLDFARMSNTEMRLDVADTLCFQLGEVKRRITWRQFILALGLHSEEEMAKPGFGAYWAGSERVIPDKGNLKDYWVEILFDRDFLRPVPSYVYIRDPVRRLCHRMIACSIFGKGQGAEKVTRVDLFYLRTINRRTANVLHILAQYLFHHAEGRKCRGRLSGGYFIGWLAVHFGLSSDEGLSGLSVAWVASGPKRQQTIAAGALVAAEGAPAADSAPVVDEGAQAIPASVQAPQPSPTVPQPQTIYMTHIMDANGRIYQAFVGTLIGSSRLPYQRRVRPRTNDASTSAAPRTADQPDP